MNSALPQPRWSRSRWWTLLAVVFTGQIGLIIWLGDPEPIRSNPARRGPTLQVTGSGAAEMLSLVDPTLFALPHRQGFSGAAWLTVSNVDITPFAWNEPPRWLALSIADLGKNVQPRTAAEGGDSWLGLPRFEPELLLPPFREEMLFATNSSLRITGELRNRQLRTSIELPSQPHADLLSNSVVQLVIDGQGIPLTATLLARSGSEEADHYALAEARKAEFEPLKNSGRSGSTLADLAWGELVFQWHTLRATNSPPEKP